MKEIQGVPGCYFKNIKWILVSATQQSISPLIGS